MGRVRFFSLDAVDVSSDLDMLEDLQQVILGTGEVENPGQTSLRTLEVLSSEIMTTRGLCLRVVCSRQICDLTSCVPGNFVYNKRFENLEG